MPIIVENPRASTGRGIRSAASALGGAVTQVAKDYESERLEKEIEQRSQQQSRELAVFRQDLAEKERQDKRQELIDRNKELGTVASQEFANLQAKMKNDEKIDSVEVVNAAARIQEKTGVSFNEALKYWNALQDTEDRITSRELKEERKEERDADREKRYSKYVSTQKPGLVGQDREEFMELSRKHADIKDPIKRYSVANKEYKEQQNAFKTFKETLESPTLIETAITGVSPGRIKKVSGHIKNLKRLGISDKKIDQALDDTIFDEMEKERMMAPLSPKEQSAVANIPKAVRPIAKGIGAGAERQRLQRERQISNLPDLIIGAIQDGGSVRLVAESLIQKGYSRQEVEIAFADILNKVELSPRQFNQTMEIINKPEKRSLKQIFIG